MAEDFMKIPKAEMNTVKEILRAILEFHTEDEGIIDCMARFYQKRFPNVCVETSREIAGKISTVVDGYHSKCEEAMDADINQWIMDQINSRTEEMSLEEEYWCRLNVLVAIDAVDGQSLKNMNDLAVSEWKYDMEKISGENFRIPPKGSVTEEDLNTLNRVLAEGIEKSGAMLYGCENFSQLLEQEAKEDAVKVFVTDMWTDTKLKCFQSLATWIAYQEGSLPSLPADVTLELLTVSVCAGMDADNATKNAAAGKLSWEKAIKIIKVVGAVFLTMAALYIIASLTAAVVFGIATGVGAVLGAGLTALISTAVLTICVANLLSDPMADLIQKTFQGMGKAYDISMENLKKGFDESSRLMQEKVIPQVKEYAVKFRVYGEAFYQTVKTKAEQIYRETYQKM